MYKIIGSVLLFSLCFLARAHTITLTGEDLTLQDIVRFSQKEAKVVIAADAMQRVNKSHALLLKAAQENKPIYGLNRGVGKNKDKTIFKGDTIDPEVLQASQEFNKNILYSHSAAVEPELSKKIIFPVMVIRLNMMLQGKTGVHSDVVNMLAAFINHRIQPVVPGRGSMGEGDITILSHIGLAMMGEGEVIFQSTRMPAQQAIKLCGLQPIVPFAKDALSILSSNAYSAAMGALLIIEIEEWLNKADQIFALSLEGLNGNIAPLLAQVQILRPFKGQNTTAARVRQLLQGSSLNTLSADRELQDPLSFRSMSQVHGTVRDIIESLKEKILLQINSSDDNPAVILDVRSDSSMSEQERYYYLEGTGAVIPTANFEPINWAIEFESLAIALSHVSHLSTQRIIKLGDERFTKLSRFLAPDPQTIAFGTIQKIFVSLDTEIRTLSTPLSADYFPVAGDIEDHATNAPLILHRLCKILSNLYYILGIELMHAAQAVDLRMKKDLTFELATATESLWHRYRQKVSFLQKDRPLFNDIHLSYEFVGNMALV